MNVKPEVSFTSEINLGENVYTEDSPNSIIAKNAMNRGAMQKLIEFKELLDFLEGKKMDTVVEIGTATGGTFYAFCQMASSDAHIVSIDLPGGPFGGGYELDDVQLFKTYAKIGQTIYFMREDSHKDSTKSGLIERLKDRKIDVLFIDGDHTYEGVKKDFELYAPLVAKGGVIIFHDICKHATVPDCQVDKFWNEIKDKYESKEFIDPNDTEWGGIGVVIKD
ncbi:class I SAM-dependent methyltransferase [Candidatus Woesearchaeota archaeon]|nr:class I SAM-dependent methyltransferase [Candidatus Woesearchaeota archaeon]